MASKVYLLTGFFLDERQVFAVFSTREAAEAALRFGDEESAIEEFIVDPPLPSAPAGHSFWNVQEFNGHSAVRLVAFDRPLDDHVIDEGDCYMVNVWALDEEHALRTGMEMIGRFKAERGVVA